MIQSGDSKGAAPPSLNGGVGLIPAREPGNPEYLVRVVYVIPTDRLLDYTVSPDCPGSDCPLYSQKVDTETRRIQTSFEAISDRIERDINIFALTLDPTAPGRKMNLERENNGTGQIRVLVIHGSLPTKAVPPTPSYWASMNGYRGPFYSTVVGDIIGDSTALIQATRKTVYNIIPDILEWDNCADFPACTSLGTKGFIGGGQNLQSTSSGWGGIGLHSSGHIFTPPASNPMDLQSRRIAFNQFLCMTDTQIQRPNPYSGMMEIWNLSVPSSVNDYSTQLSSTMGVLAHESGHAFGLGHAGGSPEPWYIDYMGGSHHFYGSGIAEMYTLDCSCAYPYGQGSAHPFPNHVIGQYESSVGPIYSHLLSFSPYFDPVLNPDKTDPISDSAYPPQGSVFPSSLPPWNIKVSALELPVLNQSGVNALYVYDFGGQSLKRFSADGISNPATVDHPIASGSPPRGLLGFGLDVNDRAGNIRAEPLNVFRMVKDGQVQNNVVFVRPIGSLEIPAATLGSYNRAYTDIQTAVNAVAASGYGTVFVANGTYPVTASIHPRPGVNIVGESVGGVILDGLGNAGLDLIYANGAVTSRIIDMIISNLTFVNARKGIANLKTDSSATCRDSSIVNCVFYNLSTAAIDLKHMDWTMNFIQNTVVDCGSGILLDTYPVSGPSVVYNPAWRFNFKNNLVIHRTSAGTTGIRLHDINSLLDDGLFIGWKGRTGWNNSFGFASNYAGNTYPVGGMEGDISVAVNFVASSPPDFRLQTGSRGMNEADPLNQNADGTRRHIGAFLPTTIIVTPTPTTTPTPTPSPTSPPCPSPLPTITPSPTPTPIPNSTMDWEFYH